MNGRSCGIRMWAQISFVLSQSTRLSDGQTDGHHVCNATLKLLSYGIERKMGAILRCELWRCITNKYQNCHASVCFKFSQLCFCQILFELVYSWEGFLKNKSVNFLLRHSVEVCEHDIS